MATMTDEARAKRAAYMRQWRKRNPEKVQEANRLYWERKADKANADDTDEQGDTWDEQTRAS